MKRKRLWLPLLCLVVSVLYSPAWGQGGRNLKKITIGVPARNNSVFGILAAEMLGFDREEGLDVDLVVMAPQLTTQALIAGDLNFMTYVSIGVKAALRGLPLRTVMSLTKEPPLIFVTRPEIPKMTDLKGKTVGVGPLKGVFDLAIRRMLKKHGLKPDVDVNLVAMPGASFILYSALRAGRIAGALLALPYNKMAVEAGFHEQMRMGEVVPASTTGLTTNMRQIRSDPDAIVRLIRAILKGLRVLKEDKAVFLKILAKEMRIKKKAMADLMYDDSTKIYSYTGIPPEASLLESIAVGKENLDMTRDVSISEVSDFSFARKALESLKN